MVSLTRTNSISPSEANSSSAGQENYENRRLAATWMRAHHFSILSLSNAIHINVLLPSTTVSCK